MVDSEFANKYLFKPIGINEIPDHEMKSFGIDDVFGKDVTGWIKDPSGITVGGWGLTITPRDMACLGFLYLLGKLMLSIPLQEQPQLPQRSLWLV
jgi:CubicO group peptidase (beta-lactamase class C family)